MKLFAQHGAQEGAKIDEAIDMKIIDGVIYSPRDVTKDNLKLKLADLSKKNKELELLFDPQVYACFLASHENSRLGKLPDEYSWYFTNRSRSELEQEQNIVEDIKKTIEFQRPLKLTGIISPNIHISRSFDSIEAVIAKNFIRNSNRIYKRYKEKRPLYASLVVSREALADRQNLQEFLNEITLLDDPPSGIYLLISANSPDSRGEVFNENTIAGWMLLNYSLSVNGFKVINGYSDLLSPYLGIAGGYAGATGWFSNLRTFSMNRFMPSVGGRLPIPRYLSNILLNRITFTELDLLRKIIPEICNQLNLDSLYDPNSGSEPQRNQEVHQSWEAIKALNKQFESNRIEERLKKCLATIAQAKEMYARITRKGITLDTKSNGDHLEGLEEGLSLFSKTAEILTK